MQKAELLNNILEKLDKTDPEKYTEDDFKNIVHNLPVGIDLIVTYKQVQTYTSEVKVLFRKNTQEKEIHFESIAYRVKGIDKTFETAKGAIAVNNSKAFFRKIDSILKPRKSNTDLNQTFTDTTTTEPEINVNRFKGALFPIIDILEDHPIEIPHPDSSSVSENGNSSFTGYADALQYGLDNDNAELLNTICVKLLSSKILHQTSHSSHITRKLAGAIAEYCKSLKKKDLKSASN